MKAEFEIREEDPSSGVSTSVIFTDEIRVEDKDDIEWEMEYLIDEASVSNRKPSVDDLIKDDFNEGRYYVTFGGYKTDKLYRLEMWCTEEQPASIEDLKSE